MQVTEVNDIKTYNLSHGKTIPEWLSDRKKRMLLKKDVDLRRRIQLIQDFEMPTLSNTVNVSRDGQYIVTTGIYKPRVRCYDVNQLALKFERCLDAEVVKCIILSDDYSKLLFLEEERYVELHSQFGFYYKTRIPKFGRDMTYNYSTCDTLLVGNGPEIFRLNLEVGTFLQPFETNATALNAISLNPVHNLMVVGSHEGFVEAWDPRVRERVATLDTVLQSIRNNSSSNSRVPSVTTLAFHDSLTMGVGTATGQILLYDIRANKPFLSKDHMYGLPIKTISFLDGPLDLVASLDSKIIKLWNRNTGSPLTAIQAEHDLNMLATYPNSGMMFVANEAEKILTYYIPAIGPAPKWCSFLDRITEELEESNENTIYDDYKFVTEQELEEIGLVDLVGTSLLRAHMHGYYIDMRLYRKARDASQPFAYEEYRKKKIREKIEAQRVDRVQVADKLPKVNRQLAERLLYEEQQDKRGKKYKPNPLKDDRFSAMFTNPDFEIDEASEEFRLLNPVLSRMAKPEKKESRPIYADLFEKDKHTSDSDDDFFGGDNNDIEPEESSSSDSENANDATQIETSKKPISKPNPKLIQATTTKVFRLKPENNIYSNEISVKKRAQLEEQTLEQRLKREQSKLEGDSIQMLRGGAGGNRIMTFVHKPSGRDRQEDVRNKVTQNQIISHVQERKKLVRRTTGLKFDKKKF